MSRTGIVLAGGRGSRMGAFKPLLSFRGRKLIEYPVAALRPLCVEILVMAGDRAADLRVDAAATLADPCEGPHVALAIAARAARHPTLVVAPADAPFLTAATYAPLLAVGRSAMFVDAEGIANPLVAVYERDALLDALVGARSLQEAARRLGAACVEIASLAPELADMDTPEDLAQHDADAQSTSRRW